MNKEFKLPDVGEGLTEADIVSWHVKPGDTIEDGQVIVEIETAKAVVELPSPYAGTVTGLLVEEGQTVDVGTPIIAVDVGGTDGKPAAEPATAEPATAEPATAEAAAAQAAVQAATEPGATEPAGATEPEGTVPEAAVPDAPTDAPPARQAVLVGYGVKPGSTSRRARKKPPTRPGSYPPSPAMPGTSQPGPPPPKVSRALAKPPVRRLARDLGVDLSALTGSGPEGSVTREDVQQAAGDATVRSGYPAAAPSDERHAAATASQQRTEERIPVRGVRKHIAAAMVASAFTAPHVTEFLQVDVTETMAAVRRARELPEFAEVKVSPLLFVAKALLVAAGRHPMVNSTWDEAAQEIVVKPYVNLGIAVAAERGLLVPNVKGAQALSLAGLARALDELAATARAGKATPGDLTGGTITITNVGVFGVDAGTPILTPGEAAILAFGQVRDAPWVHQGELAVRKVTTLSLSFDHRIVDGQLGSAVLRDVGSMLEDPVRMLAWS
ncbi:MAG: dihydrolipoamide acetyltransferase family protein [Trebonia sp.]|uniref:dihydrolipoamide acetyltransferase family protein n=1 Tax=Trebonia sp. TaxID=2767075 RepID=UPI003C768F5F